MTSKKLNDLSRAVERDMATAVGQLKAAMPVILMIKAQVASKVGVTFYAGNENVWLADQVPPEYIKLEDR